LIDPKVRECMGLPQEPPSNTVRRLQISLSGELVGDLTAAEAGLAEGARLDVQEEEQPRYIFDPADFEHTDESSIDYRFKTVLVGESCVGKSNLLSQYACDDFYQGTPHTVGVQFETKVLRVRDTASGTDLLVKLQIWDTSGDERYRDIASAYYRGAVGIFLVYDITSHDSYDALRTHWLPDIHVNSEYPNCAKVLVGNKQDRAQFREVSSNEAAQLAASEDILALETSALDATNVCEMFQQMTVLLLEAAEPLEPPAGTVSLEGSSEPNADEPEQKNCAVQ